jgi:OmpA-OmpF porin, OOP family
MRKLAVAAALASTAMASPAVARDKAWYIGVEGGAMLIEDLNLDIGTLANSAKVDHKTGYDVDGIVGYDFGSVRIEAEVGYREARATNYTSPTTTFRGPGLPAAPAGLGRVSGKSTALSFMMNGLLDFGDDESLNGFVGGGVGLARVKLSDYSINPTGRFLNDSDTGFAYQAIAGVRAPLTSGVDVGLKYRFFNVDGNDLVDALGRANRGRFRSHSLLGSLIFNFGGEPAAPPPPPPMAEVAPPPPPPPAPEPVARVCTPGPYIVFFDHDKADITPEAASILDNAVTAYGDCGQAQVMLAGYADTSGNPRYNVGLSQRRSDNVKIYMAGKGIPDGVMSTRALGETALRVQTADGVRELQNRRVEINYGPGAGM